MLIVHRPGDVMTTMLDQLLACAALPILYRKNFNSKPSGNEVYSKKFGNEVYYTMFQYYPRSYCEVNLISREF
jgi:hypothetical protein